MRCLSITTISINAAEWIERARASLYCWYCWQMNKITDKALTIVLVDGAIKFMATNSSNSFAVNLCTQCWRLEDGQCLQCNAHLTTRLYKSATNYNQQYCCRCAYNILSLPGFLVSMRQCSLVKKVSPNTSGTTSCHDLLNDFYQQSSALPTTKN